MRVKFIEVLSFILNFSFKLIDHILMYFWIFVDQFFKLILLFLVQYVSSIKLSEINRCFPVYSWCLIKSLLMILVILYQRKLECWNIVFDSWNITVCMWTFNFFTLKCWDSWRFSFVAIKKISGLVVNLCLETILSNMIFLSTEFAH